jgi:hypothetical protein
MTLLVPSSLHPKFSAGYSANLGKDTSPSPTLPLRHQNGNGD